MSNDNLFKGIALVAGAMVCCSILSFAILAWNEPAATPPEGNVAAPINTGDTSQSKTGDLGLQTGTESGSPLYYWISRIGQSLAFLNNAKQSALEIGQDKNVVATTKFSAPEICLNGVCRTTWPDGGGDSNWSVSYSGSLPLPAGNKRIFYLEHNLYSAMTGETAADALCQASADSQFLNGTFKALVYFGNRDISNVLPAGNAFWVRGNEVAPGMYNWSQIATSRESLFTAGTGGQILLAPIDEVGNRVLTGFAPDGDGTYTLFNDTVARACINPSAVRHKGACYYGNDNGYYCIVGSPQALNKLWATGNNPTNLCEWGTYVKSCQGFEICYKNKAFFPTAEAEFSLYCVEQ